MLVTTQTENPFRDCSVRTKEKVSTGKNGLHSQRKTKIFEQEITSRNFAKKIANLFFLFIDFVKQVFSLFAAVIVFKLANKRCLLSQVKAVFCAQLIGGRL